MRRAGSARTGLVAIAMVLTLGAAACGGDEETAQDRVCAAREDLGTAIAAVVESVQAGNLGVARDQLDDVRTAFKDLSDATAELADEKRAAVEQSLADAGAALSRLPDADNLTQAGEALDEARTAMQTALDVLGAELSCP